MQVREVFAHIAHLPNVCLGLVQVLADIVGCCVAQESVEGVDTTLQSVQPHYSTQCRTVFVYRLAGLLQAIHGIVGVTYRCVYRVSSSGLNDLSHKLHSVRYLLQIYFIFVKNQMQFVPKEFFCGIVSCNHVLLPLGYDNKIIHKAQEASVELCDEVYHKLIKERQVEVGKELARDVPDRHTYHIVSVEQTLVLRQVVPEGKIPSFDAVLLRTMEDNDFRQIQERVLVRTCIVLVYERLKLLPEDSLVDAHKEGPNIEAANPGFGSVIFTDLRHILCQPVTSRYGSESLAAVEGHVALGLMSLLKIGIETQSNPMLDYSVSEVRSKDLPEPWPCDYKAEARSRKISSRLNLSSQSHQIIRKTYPIIDALAACHLVRATIVECLYPTSLGYLIECGDRPDVVGVVLVVVVDVAITEIDVPGVQRRVLRTTPVVAGRRRCDDC